MVMRDAASRVVLGVAFLFALVMILRQSVRVDMGFGDVQANLPPTSNPFSCADGSC